MPDVLLFREAVDQFLAYHRLYSRNTYAMRSQFNVMDRLFPADATVLEIDRRAIEAMFSRRLDAGRVTRATLNRNRAALSVFFTWAIDNELHPGPNPVKKVRRFHEARGAYRWLRPEEASRLVLAASPHLKPIIQAGLYTGGRLREVLSLEWAQVDFEARRVTFTWETTKGKNTRSVPLVAALRDVLLQMRRGRSNEKVFVWNDKPIASIKTAFKTAANKAGLRPPMLRYRDLRHTFSTWARLNGVDLFTLQAWLGHSTIEMTMIYAHVTPEHLEEQARFIGPPVLRKPTPSVEA